MTDRFAGRYAIERELGRGSFGVVCLATDVELERPVALKILHTALAVDPATVQLFKREAAVLARLDHDCIIPVYDVGVSGDARYIVMKYVAGASLAQVLAREGAQPVARVMTWLEQIAAGLDYAHSRGVLHRDLKPGNLLLDAARERIVITDFGLAHAVQNSGGSSSQQSRQATSGTVGYLAPEVLQGQAATAASDRYSLGCVLYELLAGRPPFTGDNAMAIMFQHVQAPPPALTLEEVQRAAHTSAEKELAAAAKALAAQVMALLAKTPAQRPTSAQAVVQAVAAAATEYRAGAAAEQERQRRAAETQARQKAAAAAAEQERQRRAAEEQARQEQAAVAAAAAEQERQRRAAEENAQAAAQKRQHRRATWPLWVTALVVLGGIVFFLNYIAGNNASPPATANPAIVLPTPAPLAATVAPGEAAAPSNGNELPVAISAADALYEATGIRFVPVPAGEFTMGSPDGVGDSDEHPQHTVYLDAYYIGLTEVTNAQYARFIDAGGYDNADYWSADGWAWQGTNNVTAPSYWDNTPWNQPDQPVVGVTWYEAEAFTRWLSATSGVTVRLPTEAEWEKAACGTDARTYPWGDAASDATLANFNNNVGKTTAVGAYPSGASPYGALDMAGNVWEWTADWYDASYYATSPDQNPTGPSGGDGRVVRGGAWYEDKEVVRCAFRDRSVPVNRFGNGFRVVSPGS